MLLLGLIWTIWFRVRIILRRMRRKKKRKNSITRPCGGFFFPIFLSESRSLLTNPLGLYTCQRVFLSLFFIPPTLPFRFHERPDMSICGKCLYVILGALCLVNCLQWIFIFLDSGFGFHLGLTLLRWDVFFFFTLVLVVFFLFVWAFCSWLRGVRGLGL